MPTFQELERALVNADKAGDANAARLIAQEMKAMSGGQINPFEPVQPTEQPATPEERPNLFGAGFDIGMEQLGLVPEQMALTAAPALQKELQGTLQGYELLDQGKSLEEAQQILAKQGLTPDLGSLNYYSNQDPARRSELKQVQEGRLSQAGEEAIGAIRETTAAGERMAKIRETAGVKDFTDIESLSDFSNWLKFSLGQAGPQVGAVMATAALTRSPTAALGTSMPLSLGESVQNRLEFIQQATKNLSEEDQARAIVEYIGQTNDVTMATALVSGTLDLAGPVRTLLMKPLQREIAGQATKAALKRLPGEILEEGVTGALQEVTQIAGQRTLGEQEGDLLSGDNLKRVVNSAAAEAAGGAFGGGVNTTTAVGKDIVNDLAKARVDQEIDRIRRQQIVADNEDLIGDEFEKLVARYQQAGKSQSEAMLAAGQDLRTGRLDRPVEVDDVAPEQRAVEPSVSAPVGGVEPPPVTDDLADVDAGRMDVPPVTTPDVGVGEAGVSDTVTADEAVARAQQVMQTSGGVLSHEVEYESRVLRERYGDEVADAFDAETQRINKDVTDQRLAAQNKQKETTETPAEKQQTEQQLAETAAPLPEGAVMSEELEIDTKPIEDLSGVTHVGRVLSALESQFADMSEDQQIRLADEVYRAAKAAEEKVPAADMVEVRERAQQLILEGQSPEIAFKKAVKEFEGTQRFQMTGEQQTELETLKSANNDKLKQMGVSREDMVSVLLTPFKDRDITNPIERERAITAVLDKALERAFTYTPEERTLPISDAVEEVEQQLLEVKQQTRREARRAARLALVERGRAAQRRREELGVSAETASVLTELTAQDRAQVTDEQREQFQVVTPEQVKKAENRNNTSLVSQLKDDLEFLDAEFDPVNELMRVRRDNERTIAKALGEETTEIDDLPEFDDPAFEEKYIEWFVKQNSPEARRARRGGSNLADEVPTRAEVELEISEPTLRKLLDNYMERRLAVAGRALAVVTDPNMQVDRKGNPRAENDELEAVTLAKEILGRELPKTKRVRGKAGVAEKAVVPYKKEGVRYPIQPEELARVRDDFERFDANYQVRYYGAKYDPIIEAQLRFARADGVNTLTDDLANPELAGFDRARPLLDYIKRMGSAFQKTLAGRLAPILGDVRVQIVADPNEIENVFVRNEFSTDTPPKGFYHNGVIYLNNNPDFNGVNSVIALHEAVHAATADIIERVLYPVPGRPASENQKKAVLELIDIMNKAGERHLARVKSGTASPAEVAMAENGAFTDPVEFIAYGLTQPEMQQFISGMTSIQRKGTKTLRGMITRFFDAIRTMLNMPTKYATAFDDLVTVAETLYAGPVIEASPEAIGYAARQVQRETKAQSALRVSKDYAKNNQDFWGLMADGALFDDRRVSFINAIWDSLSSKTLRVAMMPLYLADVVRLGKTRGLNNVERVQRIMGEMQGMRNTMLEETAGITDLWGNFINKFREGGELLADIMNFSTYINIDPSLYNSVADAEARAPAFQKLIQERDAVDADGNATVSDVRRGQIESELAQLRTDTQQLLNMWEQLGRIDVKRQKYQLPKSQLIDGRRSRTMRNFDQTEATGHRLYKQALEAYRDMLDLHMEILREKVEKSPAEGDINDITSPKGKLMSAVVFRFQQMRDDAGVYFPLARFGDHWAVMNPGTQQREFITSESAVGRDTAIRERLRALAPDMTFEEALADDVIRKGDTGLDIATELADPTTGSQLLKEITEVIDAGNITDKQEMKDAVYQLFLLTLPEQDIRRQFLVRKKVPGFTDDVLRAFVQAQQNGINQLSRLRYASRLRNTLGQAYAETAGDPQGPKKVLIVDELARRTANEIDPPPQQAETALGQRIARGVNMTVFYYLLTSVKSALVQVTQLPVVGLPVLYREFDAGRVTVTMGKYANVFQQIGYVDRDVNGNLNVAFGNVSMEAADRVQSNPLLLAAFEQGRYASDVLISTNASDIAQLSRAPSYEQQRVLGKLKHNVLNSMAVLFHTSERLGREYMYMSSFELALEQEMQRRNITNVTPEMLALARDFIQARRVEDIPAMEAIQQEMEANQMGGQYEQLLEAFDAAFNRAVDITNETMLNFSNYNKPPALKVPIIRIPAQFMSYMYQMAYFIMRHMYKIVNTYSTFEERKAAAGTMFGMMGMVWMFAGVVGMPFYNLMIGLFEGLREALRPDDEDDPMASMYYDMDSKGNPVGKRNLDMWLRQDFLPSMFGPDSDLANFLGLDKETAITLARMVEQGPLSVATDWNIGTSVSMGNFLAPRPIPGDTPREQLKNTAYEWGLGAFGSSLAAWVDGIDLLMNGKYDRAMEKFLPAQYRGTAEAIRFVADGEKTVSGIEIKDKEFFTFGKLVGQSLGFKSTEISRLKDLARAAKQIDQDIAKERREVYDEFNSAIMVFNNDPTNENWQDVDKAFITMDRYNARNGIVNPITVEDVNRSLQNRAKARANAQFGFISSKKNAPFLYDLVDPNR